MVEDIKLEKVLNKICESKCFSSDTKSIINDTIKYINMRNEFLNLLHKNKLTDEELNYFKNHLSKDLTVYKTELKEIYSKLYSDKSKSLNDMIYRFAGQYVIHLDEIPNNLIESFTLFDLINSRDGKNRSPKESFILTYNDYELYTNAYNKYGFEGISKLFILNRHIYEQDKTKNICNLIYTDKDESSKPFLDNIILKFVSNESPLLDYTMKEQSEIITKIFSRNGQSLLVKNYEDRFNTDNPNIVLDDTTIELLNIDGNFHQNNTKGTIYL